MSTRIDDGYRAGAMWWNVPLLVGTVAALAWRRSRAVVALIAGYAFVLVPSLFAAHTIFFFGTLLPLLLLTYTATRLQPAREAALALLAPALVLVVVPIHQPHFDAGDYVFWATLAAIAVGLGTAMRGLDTHRAALATALAEQLRDQDVRERALLLDERARIARELHDVVAHAVSVMVVQAGAARLAVGYDDDEARTSLQAVEHTGRDALLDLRRLLEVLRPETEGNDTAPAPGLAGLDPLVARMTAAGLRIRTTVTGERRQLPAGLDLCAYRILQESLTNILKHAGPTTVEVEIDYGPGVMAITVTDDGPAEPTQQRRAAGAAGHGLVGMRERTNVFGGTLDAGPSDHGWRVSATLPLPVSDAAHLPAPLS
jgi:signal transduction histidine kinase